MQKMKTSGVNPLALLASDSLMRFGRRLAALGILASALSIPYQSAVAQGEEGLTFNFRDVPLEMVLDYFSEEAGFVIMTETEVSGSVNVWSKNPLNREEAVELLNAILNERGYAAIQKGKILKIVSADAARTENLPVRRGADPETIPANDAMVTQVIPVGYTEAGKLIEDLRPLIPESATITSNESSNAIVMTDTQNNIRRFAEIVRALDSSISGISKIKVYPLVFADAVELAEMIEELFATDDSSNNRDRRGGGPGAFFGRGRGGDENEASSGDSAAREAASRVMAVADERTNALVVSAPEAMMETIDQLIAEVDLNMQEATELELFQLANADATETAQILNNLFDGASGNSQQNTNSRFGGFFGRFGDRGGDRGGNRGNNGDDTSDRIEAQNQVFAVADPRTNSILVSAGSAMMPKLRAMVERLDSDASRKQQVYVYSLDHADVDNVALILRSMFERDDGSFGRNTSNRSGQSNDNPLNNRTVDVGGIGAQTGAGGQGRFQ